MHKHLFHVPLIVAFISFMCSHAVVSAAQPKIYLATYQSFVSEWGPGTKLKALFEQTCDCTLVFTVASEGSALLNQIKLKKQHFKADVVFGLDTSLTAQALATGFFQPHQLRPAECKATLSHTPIAFEDTFVPIDKGYFAFIYNRNRLKNPPKSFAELVERTDITLSYPDPRISTVGRGLLLWVKQLHPKQTELAWRSLAKRTLTVTPGWPESYGLLLENEVDMALSYHTSPAYHQLMEQRADYAAALFEEGHYAQVEVAAISRQTRQLPLAQTLVRFLISPEVQGIIARHNWMAPANNIKTHPVFDALPIPKGLPQFAPEHIKTSYKHWISEWWQNSRQD